MWWCNTAWKTGHLIIILGAVLRPSKLSKLPTRATEHSGEGQSSPALAFSGEKCAVYLLPGAHPEPSRGATAAHPVTTIPVPVSGVLWFSGGWKWHREEYRPWRRVPSASLACSPRVGTRRNCCISRVCTWSGKTGRHPEEQKTQTSGVPKGSQAWHPGHPARTGCSARVATGVPSCMSQQGPCWLHKELSEPGPGISAA